MLNDTQPNRHVAYFACPLRYETDWAYHPTKCGVDVSDALFERKKVRDKQCRSSKAFLLIRLLGTIIDNTCNGLNGLS
jgi:hypothetical protein